MSHQPRTPKPLGLTADQCPIPAGSIRGCRAARWLLAVVPLLLVLAPGLPALAQKARAGSGAASPKLDVAAAIEKHYEFFKTTLGASDEDWKIIRPRLEKIEQLQFLLRGGMTSGPAGRTATGARKPADAPLVAGGNTDLADARLDLRNSLKDKDAPPEEIKRKAQAVRDAEASVRLDLEKAQQNLRDILTVRQEGQLILLGVLE